jgi:nucleotide-binding universal stress UspA family protein
MKTGSKNILVPVDFAQPSLHALRFACELGRVMKADIYLLYVVSKMDAISELFRDADELVKITLEVKNRFDELAKQYKKEFGLDFHAHVERGKPYVEILEKANKIKARYIIMGDNHYKDKGVKILGSNANRVVRESSCPVITVKAETDHVFDHIVVPVDLSKESSKQVFVAIALGMQHNASVHLVSVVIGGIGSKESRIYKKMKKIQGVLEENGLHCTTKLYERSDTPPYKRVLDYAHTMKADMILMMTHQEGVEHDNYIGAFAYQIINESDIPVMTLTSRAIEKDVRRVLKKVIDPLGILKL